MRNLTGTPAFPADRLWAVLRVAGILMAGASMGILPAEAQELTNEMLSVKIDARDGSYQIARRGARAVLTSGVAARIDGRWLKPGDYPQHQAAESSFSDELGAGRQITLTCSGKNDAPD